MQPRDDVGGLRAVYPDASLHSPMPTTPQPPILKLLGGAIIEAGGVPLGAGGAHRHRLALLALLAVSKRPVTRDKLMGYLWPERDTDSARALLRTAVYELRKLLGEDAIRRTGDTLSIDPAVLRCDVLEFEAAVAGNDFGRAAALYTGAFVDGFFLKEAEEFERWVDDERARLERLHARVRATVCEDLPLPSTEHARVEPTPPAAPPAVTTPRSVDAPRIDEKTPKRKLRSRVTAVGLASAILLTLAASLLSSHSSVGAPTPGAVVLADTEPGSALEFDRAGAGATTEKGHVVMNQVDDIAVDLIVRFEGSADAGNQALYYNGHSGLSGWGILVLSGREKEPAGTIAVLAGGIKVMATPFVLKRGVWQHVSAERHHGSMTVAVDDSSFDVGNVKVNPVGEKHRTVERTAIGGTGIPGEGFHGAIDRVQIRDLSTAFYVDRWNFDEGRGPVAVGRAGEVLDVESAKWVPGAPRSARQVLWSRLSDNCGRAVGGTVDDSTAVMHFFECTASKIAVAVHVGTDRSRALVFTRDGDALSLRAERHRPDGSEDVNGRFIATAWSSRAAGEQEFIGAAPGDVGRLTVTDSVLSFTVKANGVDRERMTFDLTKQVAIPTPGWGMLGRR